ncbi:MAG: hypothetical protein LBB13_01350, partial [Rickettsiales bacterium]|nr:hypothetical protein [Rickettsiales bacterium]
MKIKISINLVNFVIYFILAAMILSSTTETSRADVDVYDFDDLKKVIGKKEAIVNIKKSMIFADKIAIDYNVIISGPEGKENILNGNGKYGLLVVKKNLKNVQLEDLHLENGYNTDIVSDSKGGGAIHLSEGTKITLKNVVFNNNKSAFDGGAINSCGIADNRNTLIFEEKIIFSDNENTGGHVGGAIRAINSDLIFNGDAEFKNNRSLNIGSAIYSEGNDINKNTLNFRGKAIFSNNVQGSAIIAVNTNINFIGEVIFRENNSKVFGGAITSQGNEKSRNILNFYEAVIFINNESSESLGGAIFANFSELNFGGEVEFRGNKSSKSGGAMQIEDNTAVIFREQTTFNGNESTTANGGAINAFNNSKLTFLQKVVFIDNKSIGNINGEGFGGAICASSSELSFGGEVEFRGNKSSKSGGAMQIEDNIAVIFREQTTFNGNESIIANGGAINAFNNSKLTFLQKVVFIDNKSISNINDGGFGGAICASSSELNFGGEVEFRGNKSSKSGGAMQIEDNTAVIFREQTTFNGNES